MQQWIAAFEGEAQDARLVDSLLSLCERELVARIQLLSLRQLRALSRATDPDNPQTDRLNYLPPRAHAALVLRLHPDPPLPDEASEVSTREEYATIMAGRFTGDRKTCRHIVHPRDWWQRHIDLTAVFDKISRLGAPRRNNGTDHPPELGLRGDAA